MPIQALLFDLDGTLLDREMSLARFIADQHLRLIAPISDCPADVYQTCSSNGINVVSFGKTVVYQQLVAHFQLDVFPGSAARRLFDRVRKNQCPVPGNDFFARISVVLLPSRSDYERAERSATVRHRSARLTVTFLIRF